MGASSIANLFGRSPIQPLQAHMKSVVACAEVLPDFFQAALAGNWQQASTHYDTICRFENLADEQKKQIRLHMPRSFFMAIPRNDLLLMVALQDEIANTVQDIAGLMLGRELQFPQEVAETCECFYSPFLIFNEQSTGWWIPREEPAHCTGE